MRTADSVSPSLSGNDVAVSLAFYIVVYLLMFPTGILFMAGLVRRGPQEADVETTYIESGRPGRPFERATAPTRD
jgi:cytochrome d ubiquinol oxidase subunit I